MTTLNAKVILNVKTAAEWANSMEILLKGELGIESDTRLIKIGNGTDTFISLPYTAVSDINDIEGVTVTNPTDGNVLTYSNGEWVNITPSSLPADTDLSHYDNAQSGFITASDIPALPADTDLSHYDNTTSDFATVSQIPTDISQLNNDAGYITSASIPSVGDGTITIQKNSVNVDSFTTNQSGNKTINLTVPTKTSELTNDSGFITSSSQQTVNDATLTIQRNGTTVGTFTANAATNATINISVPTSVSDLTFSGDVLPTIDSAYNIGSASYKWDTVYSNSINTDSITLNGTTYNSLLGDPPFAYTPETVVSVDGTKLKDTSIGSALIYPQIKQHNGYIYLLGANNSTISKYDATTLAQEWSVSTGGTGASFDVDDSGVWLACKISGNLVKKQLSLSDGSTLWSDSTTLNLYYPQQVVCHDGKAFFFWYYLYGSQVHLCGVSIDETTYTQVDTLPDIDTGTQGVEIVPRPQVKFDSAGNLYVYLVEADHSSLSTSIYKCAASDYSTRVWAVSIGDIAGISSYYQTAISLAVDDNNVYVGCTPNGSTESVIKILNPSTGSVVETKDLSLDNGSRLQALEADNDGHLFTLAGSASSTYNVGTPYYVTKRKVSDWSIVWENSLSRYDANYGVTASFSNIADNSIWNVTYTGVTEVAGFTISSITTPAKVETSAHLMPSTNYGFSLGDTNRVWDKLYVTEISSGNIITHVDIADNLYPSSDNTFTLGTSSYKWNSAFVNNIYTNWVRPTVVAMPSSQVDIGEAYLAADPSTHFPFLSVKFYMSGTNLVEAVVPTEATNNNTNIRLLGDDTHYWTSAYFLRTYTNSLSPITGSNISSYGNLIPSSSNTYTLGDNTYVFSEVHAYKVFAGAGSSNGVYFNSDTTHSFIRDTSSNTLQLHATGTIQFQTTTSGNIISRCLVAETEFRPYTTNAYNLGSGSYRWKTIYTNNSVDVSDRRIKNNIIDLEEALPKVNSIAVKSYTMNNHDEGIMYGFIAQDELERNPELVVVPEDYDETKEDAQLGYMPNNVLFLAVKAIQELSSKVDELNAKIKVLEAKL